MPQPRVSIADQLERLTPDWDRLVHDARLGRPGHTDFEDLEERAQLLARAIVAPFRGDRR